MRGVQFPTIVLSGFVSDTIDFQNALRATVWAPTVTSGTMFLQGSPDQTSANFTRMGNLLGSGAWTWNVGPGSCCVALSDVFGGLRFARFEMSVAQAAVRSLAVITRL